MEMNIQNDAVAQQLYQQRLNSFIETRTKIENEVNRFLKSLEVDDEEFKQACNVQIGTTARDWLPALWEEPFNQEVYEQQLAKLNQYIQAVRTVSDKLQMEALACLQAQ